VGLGLVYLDSIFYKLSSKMWLEGLGSWQPSSLPMITHLRNDVLLNQEYLMKIVGWLTIFFETIFVFTFFHKKLRFPFFIIGIILHLGIFIEFPIPWFALTAIAVYLLLVPVSIWQRIFALKNSKPSLIFYYDIDCPLCVRTKIIINHLDWFKRIEFKTVQFDVADQIALQGIESDALLNDIHSVNLNGKIFLGIDTYIQVLKRIFYLYPIGLLLQFPGIYQSAKIVYQFIAKNRTTVRCTEESCGYNPPNIFKDEDFKLLQNYSLFDLKKSVLIGLVFLFSLLQFTQIYDSWLIKDLKIKIGFQDTLFDKSVKKIFNYYSPNLRAFTGITKHPVFSQAIHFDDYNHIIAVVYYNKRTKEEIWLPIIDKNGQPDVYIYGANWVNWTFRVNGHKINNINLNKGLSNYTAFWAYKNNINLNNATFIIKVKKIVSTDKWKKNFLRKQILKPWINGGYVEWKNQVFQSYIKDIEAL
jgi:predicted DCC family thiol-disulfide oxidoreductase YuxK